MSIFTCGYNTVRSDDNFDQINPSIKSIKAISVDECTWVRMVSISKIIINVSTMIVFWSDNTKTITKCIDGEKFDPEIGLAMAISRKYYELLGDKNPRASFKNQLKEVIDYTANTLKKKVKR